MAELPKPKAKPTPADLAAVAADIERFTGECELARQEVRAAEDLLGKAQQNLAAARKAFEGVVATFRGNNP